MDPGLALLQEEGTADPGLVLLQEIRNRGLGSGIWVAMGLYLAALLACAIVPFIRQKRWVRVADTDGTAASKHFIAGGTLGMFVIPLTLFATLFSGVSLVGIPSEASTNGFYTLRWTLSLVPVGIGFGTLAPRMRRWSDYRGGYITGADVVSDRFRDTGIRLVVSLVQIFAAFLYVLAQLVAIGATAESLSGGKISRVAAAGVLALIMFVYEAVGGMQSVAWTDVIQGLVLMVGFVFIFTIQDTELGGVKGATETLGSIPPFVGMVSPTSLRTQGLVLPFLFSFFPFVLYGHMQQRVFAASSEKTIKMGLVVLTLISLFITIGSTFTGVLARAHFVRLFGAQNAFSAIPVADETFGLLMRIVMVGDEDYSETSANYILGSIILAASVAALMSTADSALLSLSSSLSMDIIKPYFVPRATSNQLVWIGRATSLVVSAIAIGISTTEPDLVNLLLTQQQYLMQIVPLFMAALYNKRARPRPLLIGTVCGVIVNSIMVFGKFTDGVSDDDQETDVNIKASAGTSGLLFTILISVVLHYVPFPWLNGRWETGSWARFGDPLPEHMIGYKVEGWDHEMIHAPWTYAWSGVIFIAFFFCFTWFWQPGVVTTIADGFPAHVVQQLFVLAAMAAMLAAITYFGWGTNHSKPIVPPEKVLDESEETTSGSKVEDSMLGGDNYEEDGESSSGTPQKDAAGDVELESINKSDVTPLAVDVEV